MKKQYLLSLDQGTTSSRAVLFDKNGQVKGIGQKEFKQIYPKPGWVEHDPNEILNSQLQAVKCLLDTYKISLEEIKAIGIANQRETTIIWDNNSGKPIYNAIVWQCRRTSDICKMIKGTSLEEYIVRNTGLVLDAYFSATKVKWLLDNVEGARQKAENGELLFGTVDTWLIWNLTGGKIHATDYTNASRTMMFNINTLDWDSKVLDELQIPYRILPQVKESSSYFGATDPKVFEGYEIPIMGVAGDQQASLFGHTCFEKGEAKNTYGTGCFLLMNTGSNRAVSENNLLTTIAWGIDKKIEYAVEGSIFNTGSAVKWLRDEIGLINNVTQSEEEALKVDDTNGVYFVPAFTGLGAPYWDMYARGTIVGITRGVNRRHIIRAVLESIAYQVKDIITAMEKYSKTIIQKLKVDGGGADNNFLMQFQSDVLGVNVYKADVNETTALGASFLAGLSIGFWNDLKEIKNQVINSQLFTPVMDKLRVDESYRMWKKAIDRSLSWID